MRLNPLFKIRETPLNVAYITAPFYLPVIDNVRVCSKIKNFPSITSQNIYEVIRTTAQPIVENKYSLFTREKIWGNVAFKYINSDDRSVVFK